MANDKGKQAAGQAAARLVADGQTVGLGTGTTAAFFVAALGARVRSEGLRVRGVATSRASEELARQGGIPLVPLGADTRPDVTIDGADEIGPELCLIKGGGGALVREKIVARSSKRMVVIADESKAVKQFGFFPLPVAVLPFGADGTLVALRTLALPGATTQSAAFRRASDGSRYITDDGLYIVDMHFGGITAPPVHVEAALRALPGVVDCGLFVGIADLALVGSDDGTVRELRRP